MLTLKSLKMWQETGFLARFFAPFKERGISVDLIATSQASVTVTLDHIPGALLALLLSLHLPLSMRLSQSLSLSMSQSLSQSLSLSLSMSLSLSLSFCYLLLSWFCLYLCLCAAFSLPLCLSNTFTACSLSACVSSIRVVRRWY